MQQQCMRKPPIKTGRQVCLKMMTHGKN
nr:MULTISPECIES: hypothetical protein [Shewanella]